MNIKDVLDAYDAGKIIKRKGWKSKFLQKLKTHTIGTLDSADLSEYDWEIIEEPKKKKKVVYYKARFYERGSPFTSNALFLNEQDAIKFFGNNFIQLLTEYPIEIEEEE